MRRFRLTGTWILFSAIAIGGASGFTTCGANVREDEPATESRGEATEDEMMEDAIRDSER
jgi:hypothetical protein